MHPLIDNLLAICIQKDRCMQSVQHHASAIAFILMIAFCQLTYSQGSIPTDPQKFQIFLCLGQSNMANVDNTETHSDLVPNCFRYIMDSGSWIQVAASTYYHIETEFGLSLAAKNSAITIGTLNAAVQGTSIDQWVKGATLYNRALKAYRDNASKGILKGILWHQGESDATASQVSRYSDLIYHLIQDIRSDLGAGDIPFIIGALHRNGDQYRDSIIRIDSLMQYRLPAILFVSSEGASSGDGTHFDWNGAKLMGDRYAAAYLDYIKSPTATLAGGIAHSRTNGASSQRAYMLRQGMDGSISSTHHRIYNLAGKSFYVAGYQDYLSLISGHYERDCITFIP
jgi:hypothetical protein